MEYAYNNETLVHQIFDGNSDCLTDELYGNITDEKYNNLIKRRKFVRTRLQNQLYRNVTDTLFVPIVFHNLYKIVNGEPIHSYCDYAGGFGIDSFEYVTGNDQSICNQRMLRSLQVLNANYALSGIQFVLNSDYPNMLHATDPKFDGFYERATDGTATSPEANALKEHYNIPNTLNIYIVDFIMNRDGTSGISSYPWSVGTLGGLFIKHGHLPGDADVQSQADYKRTLMHEIGHYFGLLHINGTWYVSTDTLNIREFVSENDCNFNGDTICDTPAEPGMSNEAWYTNSNNRECIYHGYGGNYNSDDSTLQIGGYNNYFLFNEGNPEWEGYYPRYNYCDAWGIENPYGLDHCQRFTNYDNLGDFFGTKDLPENYFNQNQSEYTTDCHINLFSNLPIGYNFMRAASFPYNDCGISPINDNNYYDETKRGFTEEQFANIRYSAETDYIGCIDPNEGNYNQYALIDRGDCICSGNLSKDECGICGGPGLIYNCGCYNMAENACDCSGNILDCNGVCGGSAIIDECGVCGGSGIPVEKCDCLGNILDCAGVCGGIASINTYYYDTNGDGKGCDGNNTIECNSATCTTDDCSGDGQNGDCVYNFCSTIKPLGWHLDSSTNCDACASPIGYDECGVCGGSGMTEG